MLCFARDAFQSIVHYFGMHVFANGNDSINQVIKLGAV